MYRFTPLTGCVLLVGSLALADALLAGPRGGQIIIDPEHPQWLMRHGGGHVFVCGPGDPEDFLYRGERQPDGTRRGDQEELIRKLIEHGGNSIYLQAVRSHGGDGARDHNPFVDSDPGKGLDEDILAQWESWFSLMDEHGILIYFFLFDDSARLWGQKSDPRVPAQERAFVEAIVRRFLHHDHLIWIVAEEAEEAFLTERVRAIAEVIRETDTRGHIIGCHHHSGTTFKTWQEGGPLTHYSMQLTAAGDDAHAGAVKAFREAAGRYQVIYAESTAAAPDIRHAWAVAMGGLMPMMLNMDIAGTPVETLRRCRDLQRFFERSDFWTMAPRDELAAGETRWVLADPGRSLIAYSDRLRGEMGLRGMSSGVWDLYWLDCDSGVTRQVNDVVVEAGDRSFARPAGIGEHCAVWLRRGGEQLLSASAGSPDPIALGTRLELFVEPSLVEKLEGAEYRVHRPEPGEVVLVTGEPWEGNTCAYYTLFQDGDRYRMYYRGSHYDEESGKASHPEVTCYAESRDGRRWTKPKLGLFEFEGSKENNIVWDGIGTHCFTPFKDANPSCAPDARYKAIARGRPLGRKGLYVFKSPDGIRWTLYRDEPVITDGDFDSQNLAFWDPERRLYVDYHRKGRDGRRDIMTATSSDFLSWTAPVYLEYPGAPKEHLYTNAIRSYDRAPHIRIGFPTRYQPATQQVEPIVMASRDGLTFHRWNEAVIPITAPQDRDGNRCNYMTWGLLRLPGDGRTYSVYATEAYYTGPDSRVRRFTYRVDGFVSVHAGAGGGELLTLPLTFTGRSLFLNLASRGEGRVRVGLEKPDGSPYDGFAVEECVPLRGDFIDAAVGWRGGSDVSALAGRPVRLRVELRDADLYSFRFREL